MQQPDDIDQEMNETELEEHFRNINDQSNTLYDFKQNIYHENQTISKN